MSNREIMDAVDAAAFLGVHVETLRKMARQNDIPCFKIGRDWRFRREALTSWADGQRVEQSGTAGSSILIVDDDPSICRTLGKILVRLGYRTRQTTSATGGVELVAEEAPDLILLDLFMPVMDGPSFLKVLRKDHPGIPVIIVTGFPDSKLLAEAMQYPPILLLHKPIVRELLGRTMNSVLGRGTKESRFGPREQGLG